MPDSGKRGKGGVTAPARRPRGDARTDPEVPKPSLVVGIGASAGGLEAFKGFLAHMPADSEMAFVLVQHLAPQHESMLVQLLGRSTSMPVLEAADGLSVQPRHVYVIPPDSTLTIEDGVLHLTRPAPPRQYRFPIDTFFTSLAEDQGDCAVCIVLSGVGSDGARGLRAVKEQGGLTLAQAGFDHVAMSGMPASAEATGLVDAVLPVEAMPDRLFAHSRHLLEIHDRKGADGTRQDMDAYLGTITALLRAEVGHDFSHYKQKTLVRRIQRRMQVLQAASVADYVAKLREDPREADLLFRELLISVTEFFRDPAAFEALQTLALPKLLAEKGAADTLRVWVAGCATGEEAYSVAIAIREAIDGKRGAPKVQIFATDIDDRAIGAARAGRYRKPQPGLSAERQERWFTQEGEDTLCVVKSLREMCIFSSHSAIKDPPFSQLDLISCRNLLIYMDHDLQDRLVRTFRYALKPGGFLLMGPSEGLGRNAGLFAVADKKHRLYERRSGEGATLPPLAARHPDRSPEAAMGAAAPASRPAENAIALAARQAMEKYAPAYVVVDANSQVLRSAGDVGPYLRLPSGAASLDLFALLHKGLRAAARVAVRQAFAERRPVIQEGLSITTDGRRQALRLIVEPLSDADNDAALRVCAVAFEGLGAASTSDPATSTASMPGTDGAQLQQLEQDLEATRAQWHSAIDQLETANEEMKSANEEYQSVNEELQSANEELETSKEEMQSINEELQTVNAELLAKNEALSHLNNDLQNLLESTQIATLFLDSHLHVTGFTPPMTELFRLRESDRGRPITDINARISYPDLVKDVRHVVRTLQVRERELRVPETGSTLLLRMRPYRTVENVIDGVVLTFIDITERKQREFERGQLAAIVDSSADAIIGHDLEGIVTSWNAGASRLFGYTAEEMRGRPLAVLAAETDPKSLRQLLESCAHERRVAETEMVCARRDGSRVEVGLTCSPVKDGAGQVIAGSMIARDITERQESKRHTELMLGELDHRVKNSLASVQAIALQTLASAPSQEAFKEAFLSRLMALSNTHNLLAADAWNGVGLRELVRSELAPHRKGLPARVRIVGEPLQLNPKTALALNMGLHELATNALKYGALSEPAGRVVVQWKTHQRDGVHRLHLRWTERHGPAVSEPVRRGFGTRLITQGLALELDGTATLEFKPEGLTCVIDVPLPDAGSH